MIRKLLAGLLYSQARWALDLGRAGTPHAYRLLRLACALWPGHASACHWLHYLQGRRALEQGRAEQAIELLREAARALPQVLAVRVSLGLAYTMAGQHDQAIATLERVLKEDAAAASQDAWASLAWSYLRSGRAPKAREVCRRADEFGVRSPRLDLLYRLATSVGLGSLPVGEVRELVQSVPQSISMLLEYARLQAQEGRHRLARAAVSVLPDSEEARGYSIIAHASLNEDDHKTAYWAAEQILRTKDEAFVHEAALLRSEASLRRGDFEEALQQAGRALEGGAALAGRAHEQLGRALLLHGEWEEAVAQMIEALHAGAAGALAAGTAALAALEVGDVAAARGLYLVDRHGDGLARAVSCTARARISAADETPAETVCLVGWALSELRDLPAWATPPTLWRRLTASLRQSLQAAQRSGDGAWSAEAARLLERLDRLVADLAAR